VDPDSAALNEALRYVGNFSHESLPPSGDEASLEIWRKLHPADRQPRAPPLISLYDDITAEDMGHFYTRFVKQHLSGKSRNPSLPGFFDWTNPDLNLVRDVRAMHFRLADQILSRYGPQAGRDVQALSMSLKLYSLLPLGSDFQPRVSLPCKEFFTQCRTSSQWFGGPGCLLVSCTSDNFACCLLIITVRLIWHLIVTASSGLTVILLGIGTLPFLRRTKFYKRVSITPVWGPWMSGYSRCVRHFNDLDSLTL
jgi:hypothetical protein